MKKYLGLLGLIASLAFAIDTTIVPDGTGGGGGGGSPTGPAGGSLAGTYPNPTLAGGASNTEISRVVGVTAGIQAQLNAKATNAALAGVSVALSTKIDVSSSALQAQIDGISTSVSFPLNAPESSSPQYRFTETGNDSGFGSPSDGIIDFWTNGGIRATLDSSAMNFLVGVTIPTLYMPSQPASSFFMSPNGSAGSPYFRTLVQGDIPSSAVPSPLQIPQGPTIQIRDDGDGDTGIRFTSDGILDIFANSVNTIHIEPSVTELLTSVTVNGDLNVSGNINFPSQTQNTVFAAPDGSNGTPSFRGLMAGDIPAIDISSGSPQIFGTLDAGNGGTGNTGLSNNSIPFFLDNVYQQDNQALSFSPNNRRLNIRDFFVNGDYLDEGGANIGAVGGTIVSTTAAVNSDVYRVQRSLSGTFNYVQGPSYLDQLNGVSTNLVIGHGMSIGINSASQISLLKGDDMEVNMSTDSFVEFFQMRTTTPALRGTIGNLEIDRVSPNVNPGDLQPVTGNVYGRTTFLNNITGAHVVGESIDVNSSNVSTEPFTRPISISANGASFQLNSSAQPFATATPNVVDTVNNMNTQYVVGPAGNPVGDVIGIAQTMSVSISTTVTSSLAGVGYASTGKVPLIGIQAGVTVAPPIGGEIIAFVNTFGDGGITGGHVPKSYGWKSAGVFPGGGSNTFGDMSEFWAPSGMCSGFSGTCYSLDSEDSSAKVRINSLTANRAVISNGSSELEGSTVTTTELGYLSGATANIQAQLNAVNGTRTTNAVNSDFVIPSLATDYILNVDSSGAPVTVTLPDAGASAGHCIDIKGTDAQTNDVTIDTTGGQTIDGSATDTFNTQNEARRYCPNAGQWYIYN